MKTIIKRPKDCSISEIDTFFSMVQEGDEVASEGLIQRIKRAEKLVFLIEKECVAVGAIKNPAKNYKNNVFEKAKVPDSDKYAFELGWLYVAENARGKGYGRSLMDAIVKTLSDKKAFATTRENNDSMHYLFGQFNFSRVGQPYKSNQGNYSLVLYVRQPNHLFSMLS